jgi:hypothetical protein
MPEAGSAFISTPIAVNTNTGFHVNFRFRLHDGNGTGGADGIAFILQNSPAGRFALGGGGGYMGYDPNITNSLAVEFDTWNNGVLMNETDDNHVGVLINGDTTHTLGTFSPAFNMNDGNPVYVWIQYSGGTNTLDVYINNTNTQPGAPLLSANVDLYALVGAQAYLGFSGGTGGLYNIQDIEDFTFQSLNTSCPSGTVGNICYIPCAGPCPLSHCTIYIPGLTDCLDIGQISYCPRSINWFPNLCTVYIP